MWRHAPPSFCNVASCSTLLHKRGIMFHPPSSTWHQVPPSCLPRTLSLPPTSKCTLQEVKALVITLPPLLTISQDGVADSGLFEVWGEATGMVGVEG